MDSDSTSRQPTSMDSDSTSRQPTSMDRDSTPRKAYLNGQRFHEGEDPWSLVLRFLNDDGHPDLHEGLGEVHLALSVSRDGQSSYGHVRFLERERLQECPDLNSFS